MKSITFTTGKFKEEKTSAWLAGFIKKKPEWLPAVNNKFLLVAKAYSTVWPTNIAKTIKKKAWEEADGCVDVFELPIVNKLRNIVVRTLTRKGDFEYTMLVSKIPSRQMSAVEMFHFYNKRQTIKAFFKACNNMYYIRNLRTREFNGIHTFLWLVFITHNLLYCLKLQCLQALSLREWERKH